MASEIDNLRLQELAHRYLQDTLDTAEQLEFDQWFNKISDEPFLVPDETAHSEKDYELALFARIEKQISTARPKTHKLWYRYAAAAIILLTVGIGTYFYTSAPVIRSTILAADIAPGTAGATLTLANGKKIRLSDAGNGELAKEAGVVVSKTASGEIVYTIAGPRPGNKGLINYNTLSTAKGETYSVVLPDGSRVWLNAASSLKYPISFTGADQRRVALTGEGYFEVAKAYLPGSATRRLPFIVSSADQEVEVLGTHFNINAYGDEPGTRTTLLEGRVRVKSLLGHTESELMPGQQATGTAAGRLTVAEVETEDAVLWKNGKFAFDSEELGSIMRKVARWYDVEVEFADELQHEKVSGSVSRFANISTLLHKIEQTGGIHFQLVQKGSVKKIIITR